MKTKKNAGFSLVELIVVIAIMAVLVGVLAPAYLKYVEKSRKSTDVSAISDIMGCVASVAADVQVDVPAASTFTLASTTNSAEVSFGVTVPSGSGSSTSQSDVLAAWKDAADCDSYTLKSKSFKSLAGVATGTIKTNNAVEWKVTSGDLFGKSHEDSMGKYSSSFAGKFES
jgi:type IV pilus assembly protein PilA